MTSLKTAMRLDQTKQEDYAARIAYRDGIPGQVQKYIQKVRKYGTTDIAKMNQIMEANMKNAAEKINKSFNNNLEKYLAGNNALA